MNLTETLLAQVVALPFALLVALLAAIREAGYGHRLSRLYDLASKAPDGEVKRYFEKQAEHAASLLMERNFRWATNWLWLVLIFIFYFLVVPQVTAAFVSGTLNGYSQAVGRDASLLEVGVVTIVELVVAVLTIYSLAIVGRQCLKALSHRWKYDKFVVALVVFIAVMALGLLLLLRYGLA